MLDEQEQQNSAAQRLKKTERMGTDRIGKLMVQFAVPAIVAMVISTLYNVIDTAFLGIALPDGTGVAVTTLAWPYMLFLTGMSMLAGQGGNALAALSLGAGDKARVEKILGNTAFLLFAICAGVALLVLFFMDGVLAIIGTPAELWTQTETFIAIMSYFFAFQSLGFGLVHFMRTAGSPNLATASQVSSAVACVFFNWLFVLVLGWGVAGSAWANICGNAVNLLYVVWFFVFNKKAPFHLHLKMCVPEARLVGRIAVMGLASFAMQMGSAFVSVVFNQVVNVWGAADPIGVTGALAALGVAQKASSFAFSFIIGLSMGVQPIIGYNYGAKHWTRVIKLFKWSCIDGAIFGFMFFALSHLIPGAIIALFGVSGDLYDFAKWALQVYTIWYAFVGYQAVASSYFQSSGQPIKSMVLELVRQVIVLIPLYLFMPQLLISWFGITGLQGVTICAPISDVIATLITTVFVIREGLKLRRLRLESLR